MCQRALVNKICCCINPASCLWPSAQVQHRTKEKRYTFDVAFGYEASNRDVYEGTISPLVGRVADGMNSTVFAYGATGSGKTHTMVGELLQILVSTGVDTHFNCLECKP